MTQYRALVEEMEKEKLTTMNHLAAYDREKFEATESIQMHGNNFAFFGLTSSGKSTMINSIVGADVAETGAGAEVGKSSQVERDLVGLTWMKKPRLVHL